jgi:Ca-activated chloride channel family protein
MAVDVSGYAGKDLKPNRMEALKEWQLILRTKDLTMRIGLVVYASEAYTKAWQLLWLFLRPLRA